MSWDQIITQRQAKYPTELFVRFVARNYYSAPDRSKISFLDIGCGGGANSWYLAHEGFAVTALDASQAALGSLRHRFDEERFPANIFYVEANASNWNYPTDAFDCILDHNTLCHVHYVPFSSIRAALVDGGRFFCVAPADDTWRGTLEGKGFCRTSTKEEMREMLSMFSSVQIRKSAYPDGDNLITSWIVEAVK